MRPQSWRATISYVRLRAQAAYSWPVLYLLILGRLGQAQS